MKILKIVVVMGLITLFTSCIVSDERIEPVDHNYQLVGGELDDPVDPNEPD